MYVLISIVNYLFLSYHHQLHINYSLVKNKLFGRIIFVNHSSKPLENCHSSIRSVTIWTRPVVALTDWDRVFYFQRTK